MQNSAFNVKFLSPDNPPERV